MDGAAVVGPLHVGSAMDEACAKGGEDEVVAFLELLLVVPKGKGDGGGTGVAIVLDVYTIT